MVHGSAVHTEHGVTLLDSLSGDLNITYIRTSPLQEVHITVNPHAGVPPGGLLLAQSKHLQFVLLTVAEIGGQVHGEAGVAVGVAHKELTVQVDHGFLHDALELHQGASALPSLGGGENFGVGVGLRRVEARLTAALAVGVPVFLNHGVVGQGHGLALGRATEEG